MAPSLPDLRSKVDLLLKEHSTQRRIANLVGLHAADLAKNIRDSELPVAKIPAFLQLFKLPVPDWERKAERDMNEAERQWVQLAREPFAAFCAKVALRGGEPFTYEAGKTWDTFLKSLGESRHLFKARKSFHIDARDADEWEAPTAQNSPRNDRMLPPGDKDPANAGIASLHIVKAHHLARILLDTGAALAAPIHQSAYVFMFQDVIINRRRQIRSLIPFPKGSSISMPSDHVESTMVGLPVVQLPLPEGDKPFLEIPSGWGTRRSIVAVVTDRPLEEEIVGESRTQKEIQIERLDLLAARFSDKEKWPESDRAIWQLEYVVIG